MNPTLQDIRFDSILSNVSVAFQNEDYIADMVAPIVQSKKITGTFYKYDTSKFRKTPSLRGMGSSSKEVGYSISSDTYVCKDHALKELVPDELKEEALAPLEPEIDAAENVRERLLVEREDDLATFMSSTSNITNNTTLSGTDQWSDFVNSDPFGDIETGIESVRSKIFKAANTLLLGIETYNKLKLHPDILDRLKSGIAKVTPELLANLFDVKTVLIGRAGKETATEGQVSSLSNIWGKNAWLLYVTPRPGKKQISFAYHFQRKAKLNTDKWRDNDREGMWVRTHDFFVLKVIAVDAAYLIKNAVA